MQTRNSLIASLITLAALLAVGVFVVLERGSQHDGAATRGDSATATESILAHRDHGLLLNAPSTDHPSANRGAVAGGDPPGVSSDSEELVEVEVVRADSRAPLPNANVWVWPKQTVIDDEHGYESWLRHSTLEEHQLDAVELRSDAQGRVRVPSAALGFHVAASSGDLWGAASFGAGREQHAVVALAPDLALRVRVIDSQGAPVPGVSVALRQRRMSWTFDALTARTGAPDGTATLRHAGRFLGAGSTSSQEFVLAVRGLFDPALEATLERALDSKQPLTLVLPPTGSCEVVVVDANDRAVRGPLDVRLRFSDAKEGGDVPQSSENIVSRSAETIVFEHVALGRNLVVEVSREGSNSTLEARGLGPRKAGERVSLRVPLGANVASLRGRLVDAAGIPIVAATGRAQFESNDARTRFDTIWPVESMADGGFSFDVAPTSEVPDGAVLAIHRTSEEGAALAVGRRPLPRALVAGSYDLGDFVLVETPIAVAGTVIDADGMPVAGAAVVPTVAIDPRSDATQGPLREPWLHPGRSDKLGQFEIRCELWAGKLSVLAQKEGLVGDPQIVDPGERAVRLVLRTPAVLEGRVLLDRSLLGALVLVEAFRDESAPTPAPMPSGKPAVLAADGGFRIDGLRAGSYSIRVVYAPTGIELGRVSSCAVRTGEVTRDPRADPLDLHESFRLFNLETINERGEAIRDARAFSRQSGEPDAKWIFAPRDAGRLLLLSDGRPLDVAISAAGYLRAEFDRISASQSVTLRLASKLRLQLAGGLRVPDPPLYLGVELIPLEGGLFPGFADTGIHYFDEHGELSCQTAFAGEVRVELSLTLRGGGARSMESLRDDVPHIIRIADQAGEQVFDVSFSPDKLETAARLLRGED